MQRSVVVLGAGNWGTTLAIELSSCFSVRLWTRDAEESSAILEHGENRRFLPGIPIPTQIQVEPKYSSSLRPEDWLILVVPSARMAEVCGELAERIHPGQIVINASKGVEKASLRTMGDLIARLLPQVRLATLTGPTISREIANGEPARAVLSSSDVAALLKLRKELDLPHLSFEMSRDVQGAELCAALKGLVAVLVGIADGLGYHSNMQAVLMTYGLREFRVIAEFLGIPEKTVYGLSGMGDLITTCISPDSRNRRFGRLLAQGRTRDQALSEVGMVVEGVSMARTIVEMAHFNLDIPLFRSLADILFEGADPRSHLLSTLKRIG